MSSHIEKTRKRRAVARASVTRGFTEMEQLLQCVPVDRYQATSSFHLLESKCKQLEVLDSEIFETMLEDTTEEDLLKEVEVCDTYKRKFIGLKITFDGLQFARGEQLNIRPRLNVENTHEPVEECVAVGISADLDKNLRSQDGKNSYYFKRGYLSYSPKKHSEVIICDGKDPIKPKNNFALKERGMELSELVTFDGRLLTFEDRTGIVHEIDNNHVIPWLLLMDGDGKQEKGFKSEWATAKDEVLYVGSMGKEWTNEAGEFENNNPQYVKAITLKGEISRMNWIEEYKSMRTKLQLGDIVLIGHNQKKRMDWPLARVVEMFPGKDKQIRLVKVENSKGQFLRPVHRLYPLECVDTSVKFTSQEVIEHLREPTKINQGVSESAGVSENKSRVPVITRSGRVSVPPSFKP